MRPWVKWCIAHKMRPLLYLLLAAVSPLYLLAYTKDAWQDLKSEFKLITEEV